MQKILVVEDDFDIQELLQNFLQEAGYEVSIATDGVEAISTFSDKHFDLILLDIMLPKIDGFSVCELIRKQSQVPIIMLTALSGEEEQIRGLDLQVDDYITKPFSMPVLVRKIAAVLRRSNHLQDDKHCTIKYRNFVLDLDSFTAMVDGNTYEELNNGLNQKVEEFVAELEQYTLQNSGNLFDQFVFANDISYIELYSQRGELVSIPTIQQEETSVAQANTATSGDTIPTLSSTYYFSFLNSEERYMLIVYGEAAQIAELQQSFIQVFPIILVAIIIIAFFASWFYSRIITFPVLKISNISTKMSAMQLDWKLEEKRTDELGTLEKSLNTLSQNLSTTLSDLKNANTKLEADIEHERALEQAQMDFFSAASHELKTPITVIKGQLEGMLLGIGAYKDREKYLSRSLEVANTLEIMVQEILTISRLQTPNADYKSEYFDCIPIIQGYLRETEDLIVNRELHISLDLPAAVLVNGNSLLMEKVFSNLIGNAIKYSPNGATIDIAVHEQQQKHAFRIENSGTHIPEEALPKIFEAFYRVDQSRNRKTGGSGLGLYIVQKILQQHDSCCSVCNTKTGVQFSFEL